MYLNKFSSCTLTCSVNLSRCLLVLTTDMTYYKLQAVFATDLQSRNFLKLPKPPGVDFRAS